MGYPELIERNTSMFYLKKIGVGLLAGLVAGLILGIGARLAMRLIALAAHQATSFSMEGTLIILLSGALLGLVAGPIFVTVQAYMPGARWQGGVFGLIVLGMLSLAIPPPIQDEIARAGDHLPLIIVLFVTVFTGFGIAMQAVLPWLQPRRDARWVQARVLRVRASEAMPTKQGTSSEANSCENSSLMHMRSCLTTLAYARIAMPPPGSQSGGAAGDEEATKGW
jgi:hypothetical protein